MSDRPLGSQPKTREGAVPSPPETRIEDGDLPPWGEWFSYRDRRGQEYARVHYSRHDAGTPYSYEGDGAWARRPPNPIYPYRVHTLSGKAKVPVLLVHGEWTAERCAPYLVGKMLPMAYMGDVEAWSRPYEMKT